MLRRDKIAIQKILRELRIGQEMLWSLKFVTKSEYVDW